MGTVNRCWVVVDMTHDAATDELRELSQRIYREVDHDHEPIYALVRREYVGNLEELKMDTELLEPIQALMPEVITRLPIRNLLAFEEVIVVGADIGSHVLTTAMALFDDGVAVVVDTNLVISSDNGERRHAAMRVLTKQLGIDRVR